MKFYMIFAIALFSYGCTSIASVKWVERVGGDDRKKVWVPTCSRCGHVVDFNATQCSNPKDRSLMVWRDKALYFDFPDTPQNDYKNEQLEIVNPREQNDEIIVKDVEDDILPEDNQLSAETKIPEDDIDLELEDDPENALTSDFEDIEWAEDDLSIDDESNNIDDEDDISIDDESSNINDDNISIDNEADNSDDISINEQDNDIQSNDKLDDTDESGNNKEKENSDLPNEDFENLDWDSNSDSDEDFEDLDWDS